MKSIFAVCFLVLGMAYAGVAQAGAGEDYVKITQQDANAPGIDIRAGGDEI